MKGLNTLFFVAIASVFVGCKDDETTPTFKQADFIGEWEVKQYASTDPDAEGPCEYVITESEFEVVSGCDSGFTISIGGEYTFNGKNKITLKDNSFGVLSWVILELNGTTMKLEERFNDDKYGTVTVEKK